MSAVMQEAQTAPEVHRSDIATAAAEAIDLQKWDLNTIALAHFGDWRAATTKLKQDNAKTVLMLPTQSKIDEAVSLRNLTIKRPIADARKVAEALKSKLTQTSKKVGAELDLLVVAYEDAAKPLTEQIDAAQKLIDDEKAAKLQAEADRKQKYRDGIAKIRSYAEAARRADMTAERVLNGLGALEAMAIDDAAWEEFAVEARQALAETIEAVKATHSELVAKEAEAARLAQQAKEQAERQAELDRIAAEQKAQADALAAQQRAIEEQQAAAASALAAQQAEIARQTAALAEQQRAAEAQRLQDEQDRNDAHRRALWLEEQASQPAASIPMQPAPTQAELIELGRQIVDDIITAEILRDSIPVAEVIEHAEPPAMAPMVDDGREWKLGEIGLLFGVTVTAALVEQFGIKPARTDKAAKLYRTSQVLELRAALVAHLMSLDVA